MKKRSIFVILCLLLLTAILLWREFRTESTPMIAEDGKRIQSSVSELKELDIGGMKQWILIRGNDVSNPVLLWLHGGPGSAQMPIAQYFNKDLEKEFVVVHWDQRGAGKSNPSNFDESTMTFEQYLADGHELTNYLKEKFHQEKIYLVGHSWGTKVGITLVCDYPEDYYAYVGVSQLVSNLRSQEITYRWLEEKIENDSDKSKLEKIGKPPYVDHDQYVAFMKLTGEYGGGMDIGMLKLASIAIHSKEYRLSDFKRWLDGANRGSGPMWDSYITWDAMKEVPKVTVPVYFFSGKNDYNTPLELVRDYYEMLKASKGKELFVFEDSAHAPFMKEPDRFFDSLKKVKSETYLTSN